MHEYDLDSEPGVRSPVALARASSDRMDGLRAHAAATGRPDVLTPATMIRLQRAVGNAALVGREEERSPVLDVVASGRGQSLAPDVRTDMEARMGADFADVRVHTDSAAHESAVAVNAHAYTVGSNIVFQRDTYSPTTAAGRTMLAHELTHVVQQRRGNVDGTPAPGGIQLSHPSDRFEREAVANAERIMAGPAPEAVQRSTDSGSDPDVASVQREEDLEEDETE